MNFTTEKLEIAELLKTDPARLTEVESDIRREKANMRMDIYGVDNSKSKAHFLRKNLARVMTAKSQLAKATQK